MDPRTTNIHHGHHRPEQVTALQPEVTRPRAEVIEILAGAVFALIAEGRMSSSHIATERAEVIPMTGKLRSRDARSGHAVLPCLPNRAFMGPGNGESLSVHR